MRFSRGKLELMQEGRPTTTVAYDLDRKDYPPRFTWVHREPCYIAIQKGVYWLEGDTLMICLAPVPLPHMRLTVTGAALAPDR